MNIAVLYKGKFFNVLCPNDLIFDDFIIRNVLIKRGKKELITNIKNLKIVPGQYNILDNFL